MFYIDDIQFITIDFDSRGARFTEKVLDEVLNTVLRKVRVLVA